MSVINVAILGLGTVGSGVLTALKDREEKINTLLGSRVQVRGVLVRNPDKPRAVDGSIKVTTDFDELFDGEKPDVVIEAIGGTDNARAYISASLKAGCHVISANKDLIAKHGRELSAIAKENNVRFVFEASVGGGIPVLRTISELLRANQIEKIDAILNGTSNFILTNMRSKELSFTEALSIAQRNGYAEADPANDIEGLDAFFKAIVLSQWIYGSQPNWDDVNVEGISGVRLEELQLADRLGLRLKHLVQINNQLDIEVGPVFLDGEHPLYGVEGVDNAVRLKTDLLGTLTLQGPGAGAEATASAIVEDLLSLYETKSDRAGTFSRVGHQKQKQKKEGTTHSLIFLENSHLKSAVMEFEKRGAVLQIADLGNWAGVLYQGDLDLEKIRVKDEIISIYPVQLSEAGKVRAERVLSSNVG